MLFSSKRGAEGLPEQRAVLEAGVSTSVVHPNVVSISVIIHPHIITQPVVCIQFRLMPSSLHHQPLFSMQVATYHYEIKAVQTISDEGSMQIEGGGQVKKTDWKLFLVQVRCLLGSDLNHSASCERLCGICIAIYCQFHVGAMPRIAG